MAGVKRKSGTAALRKTAARRHSARVVDLGVLSQRLGYFARRLQVWIFQDFISGWRQSISARRSSRCWW